MRNGWNVSRARVVLGTMFLLGLAAIGQADESGGDSKVVADFWYCTSPTDVFRPQ